MTAKERAAAEQALAQAIYNAVLQWAPAMIEDAQRLTRRRKLPKIPPNAAFSPC